MLARLGQKEFNNSQLKGKDEELSWIRRIIAKIPLDKLAGYGRSVSEMIDFVKDLQYVATVQH